MKVENVKRSRARAMASLRVSPRSYLHKHLYEPLAPLGKGRKKVPLSEFVIPEFLAYGTILKVNYNVQQLKMIARKYHRKVSGNKKQLMWRLYNYLKFSSYANIIQKHWRGHSRRRYNRLRGCPTERTKCVNKTDFLYFTDLENIEDRQFFSFQDEEGFYYGFDIRSLYNLIKREGSPRNPYTRKAIPPRVLGDIKACVRMAGTLKENVKLDISAPDPQISTAKRLELRTLSLFQQLDSYGHITDPSWYVSLDKVKLLRFIKELMDIWNYRAQLADHIKVSIYPPNGDPFRRINPHMLAQQEVNVVRRKVLDVIEALITRAMNAEQRAIGAYYVLTALTLVSPQAAGALPWLYESVMYENE